MGPRVAEFQLGSSSLSGITALVFVLYICRIALGYLSIGSLFIGVLYIN